MSTARKRVLPLPVDRRRGTGWLPLAVIGAGLVGTPIVVFAFTLNERMFGFCCTYGLMYGVPLLGGGAAMWRRRQQYLADVGEVREVAMAAGLTFEERVSSEDLAPYLEFSLFRLTQSLKVGACHRVQGQFEGREVIAFEYEYYGRLTLEGEGRPRKARPIRRVQTVVILPNVGDLPVFHAGPAENEWDDYWPGWTRRAATGPVVLEMDTVAQEPTVIRSGEGKRVKELFRRPRIKLLGSLTECCLESCGGHLLFYCPDLDVPPGGIPRTLGRAVDIARALTLPEDQLPGYRPEDQRITPAEPAPDAGLQAENAELRAPEGERGSLEI